MSKRFACFSCVRGFNSADDIINHAKNRHQAFWNAPRSATEQEERLSDARQQGRDEIMAQLMPELEDHRRHRDHCLRHHDQLPPMPQLL